MVDLGEAYLTALQADLDDNGVIDDNHQNVAVTLTGDTTNGVSIAGTDMIEAFFAGKQFRTLAASLDEL